MSSSVYFSKFLVTNQVFYKSKHSFALVNLKPLVPGHVLVAPLRTSAVALADLTSEESVDYFTTVRLVNRFIKSHFKADSMNIAIQDGPEAGQTVPHLHTHIIPRYRANNVGDKIYEMMDNWEFEPWAERRARYVETKNNAEFSKPDNQRIARSEEDLSQEAQELGESIAKFQANEKC
ncbi:LAFA_0G06920g1_1 [Lachancea sp. 'fantastica']|nr:LAFA_0G06920g1_1 [Lachancea sp. 'fantastica']